MRKIITILAYVFSAFMVIGRLVSGVHWFTDIVGSVFISAGLYYMYKAVVLLIDKGEFRKWNFTKNFRN
jgi:undecaprenyl-diphosphatase